MSQKQGSSKKARGKHSGREPGDQRKTGQSGGPRTKLTDLQKVLMGKPLKAGYGQEAKQD